MYIGMIETRSLKILLKSFHENYSDLFKKTTRYATHLPYQRHYIQIYNVFGSTCLSFTMKMSPLFGSPCEGKTLALG